jgi:hypothetical protein
MKIFKSFVQKVTQFCKQERGTQLVELAIVMPLFVVLMASAAEFGRFFYTYSALNNAVRAGARHASRWERSASWTLPQTKNMVVYGDFGGGSTPILPGLTTSMVEVDSYGPNAMSIDHVTVRINGYTYTPIFDLGKLTGTPALSLAVNMNASATMHQLFNGPVAD